MAERITGLKQISTGWYHIRGIGPCNWVQTPEWPATEAVIREHAFPEASEEFIKLVIEAAEREQDYIRQVGQPKEERSC